MSKPILTIAILTIERRVEKLEKLLDTIDTQCQSMGLTPSPTIEGLYSDAEKPDHRLRAKTYFDTPNNDDIVEVLTYCTPLWDRQDHSLSVSTKRNVLIEHASGEYIAFVDDDDLLSSNYVEKILIAAKSDVAPDVITFLAYVFIPGKERGMCIYGPFDVNRNTTTVDGASYYERLPNHLCAWRRSLCLPYTPGIAAEDSEWAERMKAAHSKLVFAHVDQVLYEYHWNPNDSVQTAKSVPVGADGRPAYLRSPHSGRK